VNALCETMTFLSDALAADPATALAHCAAWLDPVGLMTESDDYDFIGEDDPVEMALWVTRRAFPDVYADAIRALRAGAGHIEIDNLICAGLSEHGLPADNIEYLGWGIPLPAYGVTLEDADFYPANPEAARVLAAFGVSPEPNPYRIDIPQICYTAGHLLGADLIEYPDADWQNVGWALGHLWSCTGNSVVLCGIESSLSSTSRTNHTVTIPDQAYRVAELLAVDLEAHIDMRYRQMAWLLRWLFSSTNNSCLDWDHETMYSVEPLSWEPEDVEFAFTIIQEAETIMADIQSALKWIQENPVVLVGLALNVAQLYQALEKRPQEPPRLTFHWFDLDHEALDEVLGRIGISAGKIKVTSRSSADPS